MKNFKVRISLATVIAVTGVLFLPHRVGASPLQLVTKPDPALKPSATAGGDSYLPIMTPDGRFVLFASTAANVVQLGANAEPRTQFPARLNVFRKDRTNDSTMLISVNLTTTGGGNGDSLPTGISSDGRYALFESTASDLVAGDTNKVRDVFVRDVVLGKTFLVTASTSGGFGDKASYSSVMTPDGRYVAYASAASNLVAGDTNGIADIFERDLVSNLTTLVSVGAQTTPTLGSQLGSEAPLITPDGRYVAFQSSALKLLPGVSNFANIYIRDLLNQTTILASSGALAALQSVVKASNAVSFSPALSSDGRYVAFQTAPYPLSVISPNLVLRYDAQTGIIDLIDTNAPPAPGGLYLDTQNLDMTPDGRFVAYVAIVRDVPATTSTIRLWDAQTQISLLVSTDQAHGIVTNSISDSPAIDEAGRFVAFVSNAIIEGTNKAPGALHVYVADTQNGALSLVDANSNGGGSGVEPDLAPVMSADGRLVAFHSQENDLVPADNNRSYDVFVQTTPTATNEVISTPAPNLPGLVANGTVTLTSQALSWDGRLAVFASDAPDLAGNDANGSLDVFVRDVITGTNLLLSINTNGTSGDGLSGEAVISADGGTVAFASYADDLVAGDTNQAKDVFVASLPGGRPVLASVNYAGTSAGNGDSFSPLLSTNGQYLLFHSRAGDLSLGGMAVGRDNLFWRDLRQNQTYALTTNGVTSSSMTPDGRQVAFVTGSSFNALNPVSDRLYLWDSKAGGIVLSLTGSGSAFSTVALSPDGSRMAYVTNYVGISGIWAKDRTLGTNWQVTTLSTLSDATFRFSGNGRFLAYLAYSGAFLQRQVYLYDFESGTNLLISQSYDGAAVGDDHSDSPEISADGRFIAYHSDADNLVPGDTNGVPDLFVYDQLNNTTTLVWANLDGNLSAQNGSFSPVFSGDSRSLLFATWASDLVTRDFNNSLDLFLLSLVSSEEITPFAVSVSPNSPSNGGNRLNWTVVPGKTYQVLFKNTLSDTVWQPLNTPISALGSQATVRDTSTSASARFYRIVAY
jgi:Tol biopolymer transport system component